MSEEYEDLDYEDFEDPDYNEALEYSNLVEDSASKTKPYFTKKGSTIFVTINDITKLIHQKCKDIFELLGISENDAIILYTYFKWRKDLLEGEFFENEEAIRKKAGLQPETIAPEPTTAEITCPMCFDSKPKDEFEALPCRDYICKECWKEYIEYNVTRPENLFFWKCPSQGCNLVVPHTFNLKYLDSANEPNYYKKMAISYADTSKSLRWCPAPGCNYGAEVEIVGARCIDCPCGWMYCFKCGLEDHRPCNCAISLEWVKKDEAGGATAKWLLINTKDCPKCTRPIEKNLGCNYMRCRHGGCNFEFCWLCLGDWKTHNDHFKCNKYDSLSKDEKSKMEGAEQEKRQELQKYVFYYERYHNNSQAIESANKIMKGIKQEQKILAINLSLTLSQLEFLEQACQVLRNSKRSLKWSYAYGLYLENDLQRNLYEIIQEKMDMYSSELHVLLEKDYQECKVNIGDFTVFKEKVLSSVFKCKQSSEAFLQKMEEFENMILEEELNKLNAQTDAPSPKATKKGGYRKRKSGTMSGTEVGTEGPVKKATKVTKGKR